MPGLLTPILRIFRRPAPVAPPRTAEAENTTATQHRLTDRAFADALDRAMDMGLWEHAERIAMNAERLGTKSTRLIERLARLRLARNEPDVALAIIDARWKGRELPSSVRLLRAACHVRMGTRDEAHTDLLRWARRSTAPLDARVMLALLEWEAGDTHGAALALLRNLRQLEDPCSLELLVLLAVAQGRTEQAEAWSSRLAEATAFDGATGTTSLLPCSVGVHHPPPAAPTPEQIEMLAAEIASAEEVIPALVEAQRRCPRPTVNELLARAVANALPDLARPVVALEALARLALLRGSLDEARSWVERGLGLSPRSIPLEIVRLEIEAADGTLEGDVPDVLATIGPDTRLGAGPDDDSQEKAA
jgi:hypothetical protein